MPEQHEARLPASSPLRNTTNPALDELAVDLAANPCLPLLPFPKGHARRATPLSKRTNWPLHTEVPRAERSLPSCVSAMPTSPSRALAQFSASLVGA